MNTERVAGALLIVVPLAFNLCFFMLGRSFDYPDILRRPTSETLARFRTGGARLLLLWWIFALTAVLLAPLATNTPWWTGVAGIVGALLMICSPELVGAFEQKGWKLARALTPRTFAPSRAAGRLKPPGPAATSSNVSPACSPANRSPAVARSASPAWHAADSAGFPEAGELLL
jgi:Domain of unknown function (DUF4386)